MTAPKMSAVAGPSRWLRAIRKVGLSDRGSVVALGRPGQVRSADCPVSWSRVANSV